MLLKYAIYYLMSVLSNEWTWQICSTSTHNLSTLKNFSEGWQRRSTFFIHCNILHCSLCFTWFVKQNSGEILPWSHTGWTYFSTWICIYSAKFSPAAADLTEEVSITDTHQEASLCICRQMWRDSQLVSMSTYFPVPFLLFSRILLCTGWRHQFNSDIQWQAGAEPQV